jgi:S1-C subfamily serine protease
MFKRGIKSIILLCFITIIAAWSDPLAESAREISEKSQDALVSVRIILEVRKSEITVERLATVIDPSGLMVMSMASIDPSVLGLFPSGIDFQIKDITVILPDKKEIPAKIVLRDTDLDLALLQPIEKTDEPLAFIPMKDGGAPKILDQMILLSKLGSSANYTALAVPARVVGIITKPRTWYVLNISPDMGDLGAPVFDIDGALVGFVLLKVDVAAQAAPFEMLMRSGGFDILPVVLPVNEVADVISKME